MIVEIGAWVIDQACAELARLRAAFRGATDICMSVNVSARQLRSDTLMDTIAQALLRHRVPPEALCLELTESILMENLELVSGQLDAIRECGTRISIDDFGTGYSSLAYLSKLSVDELKIDRSFVKELGEDQSAASLIQAVVFIASSLGITSVAEGVETPEQAQLVGELGCTEVQGFLFARPLPPGELDTKLVELGAGSGEPPAIGPRRPRSRPSAPPPEAARVRFDDAPPRGGGCSYCSASRTAPTTGVTFDADPRVLCDRVRARRRWRPSTGRCRWVERHDTNLIVLSSVVPEGATVVRGVAAPGEFRVGDRLFCVMAEQRVSEPGAEAWAGLGWATDTEGRGGLFVEAHGHSEQQVRFDLEQTLGGHRRRPAVLDRRRPRPRAGRHHVRGRSRPARSSWRSTSRPRGAPDRARLGRLGGHRHARPVRRRGAPRPVGPARSPWSSDGWSPSSP